MFIKEKYNYKIAALLTLVALCSCSPSVQDDAAKHWAASWDEAEQMFGAGDIDETLRRIGKLLEAPEPYRAKAAAWKMLVLAGKARGYFELVEAHEQGGQQSPSQASSFWRATGTYRSRCRTESLALAEMALAADQYFGNADAIVLDFPPPTAAVEPSPLVAAAENGRLIADGQLDAVVQYTLRRAVALTICEAGQAAGQREGGSEGCGAERAVVPRPRLLAMLGKVLYEQSELFARSRLDDAEKHGLLLDLSEKLLRATLVDHQRQNARLEAWRVELANRRSTR